RSHRRAQADREPGGLEAPYRESDFMRNKLGASARGALLVSGVRNSMRSVRLLAAAIVLGATSSIAAAQVEETQPVQTGELALERVFASPSLNGASPRGVKLSPDGRYLTV